MTDEERLKRAYSAVRMPEDFALDLNLDGIERNRRRGRSKRRNINRSIAAACAAFVIFFGGMTAYAADVGGIQRTLQVWLHGDQTCVTITADDQNGVTHYRVQDKKGNELRDGGGVAIENDGTTKPLTDSEIKAALSAPEMDHMDGRIYICFKDQTIDITDEFNGDGLCFIKLEDGDQPVYITAVKNGGLYSSTKRYAEKNELPKQWLDEPRG